MVNFRTTLNCYLRAQQIESSPMSSVEIQKIFDETKDKPKDDRAFTRAEIKDIFDRINPNN